MIIIFVILFFGYWLYDDIKKSKDKEKKLKIFKEFNSKIKSTKITTEEGVFVVTKAEVPEFIHIQLNVSNLLKSSDGRYVHQEENVEKIKNGIKFVTITTKIDNINIMVEWYMKCNRHVLKKGVDTITKK